MRYTVIFDDPRLLRRLAKLERKGKLRMIRVVVIVEASDGRVLGAWSANYRVEVIPHARNPIRYFL